MWTQIQNFLPPLFILKYILFRSSDNINHSLYSFSNTGLISFSFFNIVFCVCRHWFFYDSTCLCMNEKSRGIGGGGGVGWGGESCPGYVHDNSNNNKGKLIEIIKLKNIFN